MQFGDKILLQRWTKKRGEKRKKREWGESPRGKRERGWEEEEEGGGRGRDGRGRGTDLMQTKAGRATVCYKRALNLSM
jgi:hypothetical protein